MVKCEQYQPRKYTYCFLSVDQLNRLNFNANFNWTNNNVVCFVFYRNGGLGDGCNILNWNYTHLSSLSYADAVSYTQLQTNPESISCTYHPQNLYHYEQEPGASIVQEVYHRIQNQIRLLIVSKQFIYSGIWYVRKVSGVPV